MFIGFANWSQAKIGNIMNTIYKAAQAALMAKDYNKVVLTMLQNDFDYVIGDSEYMVLVYNPNTFECDIELRSNDENRVLLDTF